MQKKPHIDYFITIIPFLLVICLCILFFIFPVTSTHILEILRLLFNDTLSSFYLLIGLCMFFASLYIAFSKFGTIKLGRGKKEHSFFSWGSMMFTAGLAADILFYSLCEWILYAGEGRIESLGGLQEWGVTYSLFHWGPIAWSFYLVLASAFGFMLHVRGKKRQKYSEGCRPILGNSVDGFAGKCIDLLAVFALIAGTATTFSLATPLLSQSLAVLLGIPSTKSLTIIILIFICIIYTLGAYFDIKGVSKLATSCTYLFFALLIYVFIGGRNSLYILESGIVSVGHLINRFIELATWIDPLKEQSFTQNWTCFYWAYWIVWCVATPFFIGSISKGRTLKEVILGGYIFGLSGTFISFIILGNYGLGLQMQGKLDIIQIYTKTQDIYYTIGEILNTLPLPILGLILLILTMIAFYVTTFDSLTLVAVSYSYKHIDDTHHASTKIKVFWAILLILLPIALLFSENSMGNLQTVSILAAFPIGIIMILILASFFKDASLYLSETRSAPKDS